MKPGIRASRPFAKALVLANAVFWITFVVYFVSQSYPYQPHQKLFEEQSPPYIFWGHAFPFDKYMTPFMRATRLIEAPSFYAATPLFWYFDSRHVVADNLYAGVDVGACYLILVCLLSFGQWYLIGLLMDYVVREHFKIGHGPASPGPGHTSRARQ